MAEAAVQSWRAEAASIQTVAISVVGTVALLSAIPPEKTSRTTWAFSGRQHRSKHHLTWRAWLTFLSKFHEAKIRNHTTVSVSM